MTKLNIPDPHRNQWEIIRSDARFRVVACGRRFGKTYIGVRSILYRAINYDDACWWLAPTYDMADHVWRDLKTAVRDIPGVQISQSDLRLDFPGGGWIAIHSTHNPDHLRGAGLDFVVLDEAAFMSPDIWPEIVRPMLVDRQGSALFLSSPNGKNWFYNLFQLGLNPTPPISPVGTPYMASTDLNIAADSVGAFRETPFAITLHDSVGAQHAAPALHSSFSPRPEGEGSGVRVHAHIASAKTPVLVGAQRAAPAIAPSSSSLWRSFHFPTSANPLISPEELQSIHDETPERVWLEEYEAEFAEDSGQVFRGIQEAATAPLNVEPVPGTRYVCGLDWGRENDYTAIVVMDTERSAVVAIDRFNQVSWSLQRGRLKAVCDRWQPVVIYAESNSIGSPNIEALQSEGLPIRPFNTTAISKPPLIESLSLAIERAEIALQPDENLLAELATYGLERLPAGGYRYSAPPGLHDDLVIALALSWHAARHSGLPISFA